MTLPYVAGLLDGEGSIMLTKKDAYNRRPQLSISMTELEPLEAAKEVLGGFISTKKRRDGWRKTIYEFSIKGGAAVEALKLLRPYLVIQRRVALADLVVNGWKPARPGPGGGSHIARRERLFSEMQAANAIRLSAVPKIASSSPTDADMSYLAGILDGEGHITPRYKAEVTSTDPELLAWCASRFGGAVYMHHVAKGNWRSTWTWCRSPTGNAWAAEVASQMQLSRKSDLLAKAQDFTRTPAPYVKRGPYYEELYPERADALMELLDQDWTIAYASEQAGIPYTTAYRIVSRARGSV